MAVNIAEVGSVYDALEEKVKGTVDSFFDSYDLTGSDKAQVIASTISTLIVKSLDSVQKQEVQDPQVEVLEATKGHKISMSSNALTMQGHDVTIKGYEKTIKQNESDISTSTKANKISLVAQQLAKLQADTSYVAEQEQQLINSVTYNNKIKALDSMADTFGTLGAGGLVVSEGMWASYFGLANSLANASIPTDTGDIARVS